MLKSLGLAFVCAASNVLGAPVAIGDYSFEGNSLDLYDYSTDLSPEWQETGGVSNGGGYEEYLDDFSDDGTDHLGMNNGHNVWQDLGVTYQANTRYTLTIAMGNRSSHTNSGNLTTYILADSTGTTYATDSADASTISANSFGDAPELIFDTPNNPAAVGQTIRILLQAGGNGRSHFDNIRLDETLLAPTVENNSATALTTTTATLNGEVTAVGSEAPTITLFYGNSDGGITPASWEASVTLPGTHSGTFSTNLTGLTPGTSYYFTARASNSGGDSWAVPTETFSSLVAPAAISNLAATNIGNNSADLGANVTDVGGDNPAVTIYYGTTDGGTTAGSWASSISLGTLSASGTASVTGLVPLTTYYFRAFASNSGGDSWASTTSSFASLTVTLAVIENRSPTGLTGTSASLRGEVTDTGSDIPSVTLYYGTTDGGTTPGSWDASINVGSESGNYSRFVSSLTPLTSYYYTASATNAVGTSWTPSAESFTTPAALPAQVIINEIHYDSADETSAEEFIELHNPSVSTIDLSGWTLTDAVDFTFPPGTTIAAGAYLVIGEDPATLSSVYGITALGPWSGGLKNEGEEIDLRNASGTVQDQVEYHSGFPWPTNPRGGGGSAELVHPSLDNNLAGSWRTSGSPPAEPELITYIEEADLNWHYFKGASEASDPVTDWRLTTFTEDDFWIIGQTPIGYGDGDDNTVLDDMQNSYTSVYLRREFTLDPQDIPTEMTLRVFVDDGAVVWINGTEVARFHVPAGQLNYNDTANDHEAAWESITLTSTDFYLIGGTNVISIHSLNTTIGSSDFSIDAELTSLTLGGSSGTDPTPGVINSSYSVSVPPQVRQVSHTPNEPASSDDVVISAKITDPDGVGPVTLDYQLVAPGSYIRISDPSYDSSWSTLTMLDDGTGGDLTAGDFIYSVTIPSSLHNHRQLVRYRIHAEDGNGLSVTLPYPDDEQPNFAYYVYNGVPSWSGSFAPTSSTENFSSTLMNELPVYQLIANNGDVIDSQYNGSGDGVHMDGTLIYDGVVYDHVEFENRGEVSTYVSGKNKWRIHFNRARRFQGRDNWGNKNSSTTSKLNMNACASPWAAVNRGMAGLDEAVSFRLYELAGVPSPRTNYFSFRVVDDAVETDPSDQYEGDLWGLYLAIEQPNGSFLDDRDLADGNVYKIEGGGGDKKEQGDTQVTDSSDWNSFYSASDNTNDETWWRDNMHMPTYYSMRGLNRLTGNVDIRYGYNHYFYHEPTNDQWYPIPWDLDMMYIAETHQAGVIRQQKALNNSQLALEFRNRCRELLDLVGSDNSTTGGQIGQLVDEYAQIVNPTGQALTWSDVDAYMWNYHPRTKGNSNNHSGQSNHKGNFFYSPYTDSRGGGSYVRTLSSQNHEGFVNHLTNYMTDTYSGGSWSPGNGVPTGYGYEYLKYEADDSDIPARPTAAFTGTAGFPVNDLTFSSDAFSDPQGSGTFSKMRWRIAQIAAPGLVGYVAGEPRTYEVETTYQSEDITSFTSSYQFPASAVTPGNTYRVRVQHEDSSGRTSHWSEAIEFVVATPNITAWQDNLMITEIMYNPPAPNATEALIATDNDDFEFLEFTNISSTLTLDLSELAFTEGITFDFAGASITSLAPGECMLLVKNQAAFEARYGTDFSIAGVYPNSLSNKGEQLQLSYALNNVIRDFEYDDKSPWPDADGSGYSMVLIDPTTAPDHSLATSWTTSAAIKGSPCGVTCVDFACWQADQFSVAELADPLISGPSADPDGDGIDNLLEHAFGTDPLAKDNLSLILYAEKLDDNGTNYFTLSYRRLLSRDHLTYIPEISPDLQAWDIAPVALTELSATDNNDGTETVLVRSNVPYASIPKEFMRIRVISNP